MREISSFSGEKHFYFALLDYSYFRTLVKDVYSRRRICVIFIGINERIELRAFVNTASVAISEYNWRSLSIARRNRIISTRFVIEVTFEAAVKL